MVNGQMKTGSGVNYERLTKSRNHEVTRNDTKKDKRAECFVSFRVTSWFISLHSRVLLGALRHSLTKNAEIRMSRVLVNAFERANRQRERTPPVVA